MQGPIDVQGIKSSNITSVGSRAGQSPDRSLPARSDALEGAAPVTNTFIMRLYRSLICSTTRIQVVVEITNRSRPQKLNIKLIG